MSSVALKKFLELKNNDIKELYNGIDIVQGDSSPIINIEGRNLINFSSCNYLGFSNDIRLINANIEATKKYGVGAGGIKEINGSLDIYVELEKKIAEFKHTEAALTFQSGYNCNLNAIPEIMGYKDLILCDDLNHLSITRGAMLSGAKILNYEHSNMRDLRNKAKEAKETGIYEKIMVATDGVFSIEGDIAKLPDILEIAEELEIITYVDDSHALGILGQNGSGSAAHHDLVGKIDIQIGTLSKAIGVVGGYIAGSSDLIYWLKNRKKTSLFSTSMTPGAAGACIEAIDILNENTELIDKLWHNGRYLKRELKKLGYNIGNSQTPITPCIIGDEAIAEEFCRNLFYEGLYVKNLEYPVVPLGTARVKNMPTAAHEEDMLKEALRAYEIVGKKMGII